MRAEKHPVLGDTEALKRVQVIFDGRKIEAIEGEPIAAALLANGVSTFRKTVKLEEARGIFCGIGQCTDCKMIVDGIANVKTCITPVKEGMVIETQCGRGNKDEKN